MKSTNTNNSIKQATNKSYRSTERLLQKRKKAFNWCKKTYERGWLGFSWQMFHSLCVIIKKSTTPYLEIGHATLFYSVGRGSVSIWQIGMPRPTIATKYKKGWETNGSRQSKGKRRPKISDDGQTMGWLQSLHWSTELLQQEKEWRHSKAFIPEPQNREEKYKAKRTS